MRKPILIIALSLALTTACQNSSQENTSIQIIPGFDYAMSNDSALSTSGKPIKLVSYSYRSTLKDNTDVSNIIDEIFSEDSYMAIPNRTHNDIVMIKNIECPEGVTLKGYYQLDTLILAGMRVFDLEWSVGNDLISSLAIVDDNDNVVYDNIGTNGSIRSVTAEKNEKTKSAFNDSLGITVPWVRHFSDTDFMGSLKYDVSFDITATFDSEGVLVGEHLQCSCKQNTIYKSDAKVMKLGGTLFSSKYLEFSWAYAAGPSPVSITWNGFTYSLPLGGGAIGEMGIEALVKPNDGDVDTLNVY